MQPLNFSFFSCKALLFSVQTPTWPLNQILTLNSPLKTWWTTLICQKCPHSQCLHLHLHIYSLLQVKVTLIISFCMRSYSSIPFMKTILLLEKLNSLTLCQEMLKSLFQSLLHWCIIGPCLHAFHAYLHHLLHPFEFNCDANDYEPQNDPLSLLNHPAYCCWVHKVELMCAANGVFERLIIISESLLSCLWLLVYTPIHVCKPKTVWDHRGIYPNDKCAHRHTRTQKMLCSLFLPF